MRFLLQLFLNSNTVLVYGILGGVNISIDDAPYQVNYGDKCSAVLIGRQWAIATAHCGRLYFIRLGSKYRLKGQKVLVIRHIFHPKYKKRHEFDYDVLLLKTWKRLHFGNNVRSIGVSGTHNGVIKVAGWGYLKENGHYSDLLQQVQLQIIPMEICQAVNISRYNNSLTDRMFCAGGNAKDACQGDSGSAAVSMDQMIGIASFGHGCGRDVPGVYTNVSHEGIRDWIRNKTGI